MESTADFRLDPAVAVAAAERALLKRTNPRGKRSDAMHVNSR
jgi:hypothetical protein